jgi:hypothetical protein
MTSLENEKKQNDRVLLSIAASFAGWAPKLPKTNLPKKRALTPLVGFLTPCRSLAPHLRLSRVPLRQARLGRQSLATLACEGKPVTS